ncbi:PDZ and LIM domain protein Zasp isoform X2 [Danaus plexippus]|uniref:PDZ and LIM domain protein Zasp isoform X2 n=1 Tax=Danaus plexippus TaxID=13037 RepID=UPI002AAFEBC4|nr:PDZ and LIM domain protein Zasp isoform X2 [Danaus plexippus]
MAQLITVRLNKSDQQPLGFRLQGGKDFGTPLVVQKVNGGSAAERAGLQAGDALIRVNNTDVYSLRHQEAQDAIRAAGGNLELTVQRGGGTWRPTVTPTGSLPRPGSRPLGAAPSPVTSTSLKATPQPSRAFGSGHNNVAKPFGYMNGNDSVKSIVNKQYNTPVSMYSDKTIAETLSAQTEVLAGGVLGVNFKKNEKTYDAEKSAVFKVLQEAENDPEPEAPRFLPSSRLAHLAPEAPHRPSIPLGCSRVLSDGRVALGPPQPPHGPLNAPTEAPHCSECNGHIVGVFVRIKDKNLHVECFKCATCGSSLKNQGYYNLNGKLYCDIHAKLVARQNPPAPNLEPVTVAPGGRVPTNAYSTPLPPLSTNNYTNGSSSMFSPSSNLSGPKPFGSSLGTYSPSSLSPRSAPLSPRTPNSAPATAPAPAPAPQHAFAPKAPGSLFKAKNVKSIVWPPPNPSEDEPESELNLNCNQTSLHSDFTSLSEETITQNTNNRKITANEIKTTDSSIAPLLQTMEFSSNALFDTTQMASSTIKSQTAVQKQRSEIKQEFSSCTVQSYSQQASDCKQFSVYQNVVAPEEMNKRNNTMEKSRLEHSSNVVQSKFKTGESVSQNFPPLNANTSNTKMQPCWNKVSDNKIQTKENPMSSKVTQSGVKAPESKKSISGKPLAGTAKTNTLQRGSLLEALTIAPDRPYSPLSFHIPTVHYNKFQSGEYQPLSSEAVPSLSFSECSQSNQSNQTSEQSAIQNSGILQSTAATSAFKPVCKQTFPPPKPQELSSQPFSNLSNQSSGYKDFSQSKQETVQEFKLSQNKTQQQESSISTTALPRSEGIPQYQQVLVPEVYNPEQQKSFTPNNPTNKVAKTDRPMTFQPVVDETSLRISPARSRPTTPGMINKPAPIIPHYQMNLVSIEHQAPESRLYKPGSTEVSRSSTPIARCHSPAPGPPANPLKAQAPRIKQTSQSTFEQAQSCNKQLSNIRKEHEMSGPELQSQMSSFSPSDLKTYNPNQPTVIKDERQANVEYRTENYSQGDLNIKEDSMLNQNYGEKQTEFQNISEYGDTTVQTTKKTFEEYESSQSAKVIEIHKGDSQTYCLNQPIDSNTQPYNSNSKQVFPPPLSTMTPTQQNLLRTNDSVVNASKRSEMYQPTPFISGANQGPVCDPTPSTGSSVGAAARGKAFGVSSAPKRGRGILNKAALPGSRVPLCGSCNGNIS